MGLVKQGESYDNVALPKGSGLEIGKWSHWFKVLGLEEISKEEGPL